MKIFKDKFDKRIYFVPYFMYGFHPLLKLRYFYQYLKNRKKAHLIPKNTLYCYDERGGCPFMKCYFTDNHALSPFAGFNWCTYLNDGDLPEFNDECKICNVSWPEDFDIKSE